MGRRITYRTNLKRWTISLDPRHRRFCVDCCPSDAVVLALQSSAPIYIEEAIMAEKGTVLQNQHQRVSPEEREKLAPFAEFINGLDLEP